MPVSSLLVEQQYETIVQQSFLPLLSTIFPRQPSRKGDTWPVPRAAAWALLGVPPSEEDYGLVAEVLEIRKNEPGTSMTAVISVKGPCVVPQGPSAINALIHFTFEPSEAATPCAIVPRPVASRPRISLRPDQPPLLTGDSGGLRCQRVYQQGQPGTGADQSARGKRRPVQAIGPARGGARTAKVGRERESPPSRFPYPLPEPSPTNTWLVYDEPQGRFHFLHPQY